MVKTDRKLDADAGTTPTRPGPGDCDDHVAVRDFGRHVPRRRLQLFSGQTFQARESPEQLLGEAPHAAIGAYRTRVRRRRLLADLFRQPGGNRTGEPQT
jgi:hypothetical protein